MIMENNIYVSTAAFKNKNIENILNMSLANGIMNIELGSNLNYSESNLDFIFKFKRNRMKFLVHNYFPPAEEEFVLNLASNNKGILRRSIQHCKKAIDLSAELGAPFYSVHAGFAFHAKPQDLGSVQKNLPRIPYEEAYRVFVESSIELADYAYKKNIKLAVENNVMQNFNLIKGRNEILLLCSLKETLSFYKDVGSLNLFFLADLGHIKVSSASLKLDKYEYIEKIRPYTIAFHINDNNSLIDQHSMFDKDAWFKDILACSRDKIFIIEADNLEIKEIISCHSILTDIKRRQWLKK
jgi:sugar phosphate isomerase/epimerase